MNIKFNKLGTFRRVQVNDLPSFQLLFYHEPLNGDFPFDLYDSVQLRNLNVCNGNDKSKNLKIKNLTTNKIIYIVIFAQMKEHMHLTSTCCNWFMTS